MDQGKDKTSNKKKRMHGTNHLLKRAGKNRQDQMNKAHKQKFSTIAAVFGTVYIERCLHNNNYIYIKRKNIASATNVMIFYMMYRITYFKNYPTPLTLVA